MMAKWHEATFIRLQIYFMCNLLYAAVQVIIISTADEMKCDVLKPVIKATHIVSKRYQYWLRWLLVGCPPNKYFGEIKKKITSFIHGNMLQSVICKMVITRLCLRVLIQWVAVKLLFKNTQNISGFRCHILFVTYHLFNISPYQVHIHNRIMNKRMPFIQTHRFPDNLIIACVNVPPPPAISYFVYSDV